MIKRPVRIVRNLGASVDDAAAAPSSVEVAKSAGLPVAQVAQQLATQQAAPVTAPAPALTQQAAPVATHTVQTQQEAPIVYKGQDPANPAEKQVSLMDYLIDNKWWVIIAVAVAYYALKSED